MNKLWIPAACGALVLSACAQQGDNNPGASTGSYAENSAAAEAASDRASLPASTSPSASPSTAPRSGANIPPAISRSAAPNVAFAHDYRFTLPADRISGVQEQHSRLCADLGLAQCEITGVDYRQSRDGSVNASLSFLIAPSVASMFGTSALAAVEAADGTLTDGAISSENVREIVDTAEQDITARNREIARLEQQAKTQRAGSPERVRTNQEIADLRALNQGGRQTQADARAKLARTPVSFTYQSAVGWFGNKASSGNSAASYASSSFNAMLSLVALLAPWVLFVGLMVWVVRKFTAPRKAGTTHTPAA